MTYFHYQIFIEERMYENLCYNSRSANSSPGSNGQSVHWRQNQPYYPARTRVGMTEVNLVSGEILPSKRKEPKHTHEPLYGSSK